MVYSLTGFIAPTDLISTTDGRDCIQLIIVQRLYSANYCAEIIFCFIVQRLYSDNYCAEIVFYFIVQRFYSALFCIGTIRFLYQCEFFSILFITIYKGHIKNINKIKFSWLRLVSFFVGNPVYIDSRLTNTRTKILTVN